MNGKKDITQTYQEVSLPKKFSNIDKKLLGQKLKTLGILNDHQIDEVLNIQNTNHIHFGKILVKNRLIRAEFLEDIVQAFEGNINAIKNLENKKFGELLIDLNYIDKNTLNEVLNEQQETPDYDSKKKLGQILISKGLIAVEKITRAFIIQKRLANIAIVTIMLAPNIHACRGPQIPVQADIGIVKNYSESTIQKVLKEDISGSVNYYQDGTIAISNVPHFQQGNDNTCGQAVMASILNFWGVNVSYQTVVSQTNSGNLPTDINVITKYMKKYGLYAQDYRLTTLNFLKDRIKKGRPVIILLDFGKLSVEHYVMAIGYNEKTQELIVSDPIDGPNVRIPYYQVEVMWENKSLKKLGIFGDKYNRIAFDISSNALD